MMAEKTLITLMILGAVFAAQPAHADVSIGITIAPPPALVVATPPQLVAVPSSPVYYVPSANFNLFVYGGRYYSFHNGTWFFAASSGGAWTIIATDRVPQPLLAVPATYYKIPPGQAKKTGGQSFGPPGHAKHGKKGRNH